MTSAGPLRGPGSGGSGAGAAPSRRRALRQPLVGASVLAGALVLALAGGGAEPGGGPGDLSLSLSPAGRPRSAARAAVTRAVPSARMTFGGRQGAARLPEAGASAPRAVPFLRGPGPAPVEPTAPGAGLDGSPVPAGAIAAAPAALAPAQTSNWADFPALGIDNDYVYVTANMFSNAGGFQYVKVWAIRKAELLAGDNTITWTEFSDPPGAGFTIQPAHSFGPTPAEHLVHEGYVDNVTAPTRRFVRLSRITHPDNVATWEDLGFVEVRFYPPSLLPGAPQSGTADRIDTNDERLLNAVFRGGSLYTTHHVLSDDGQRTEVAWYRIDPARATAAGEDVPVQQGRVAADAAAPGRFYYYPSIAVNAANDVALGFSASDNTIFASAFFTGRSASDADNTMRPVASLRAGDGPYAKSFGFDNTTGTAVHRWGDYSATVVDPVDNATFWTVQEYAGTPGNTWATWWGSFRVRPQANPPFLAGVDNQGLIDPQAQVPPGRGVIPPDTMGAAALSHLVSILNSAFGIFDKATGTKLSEVSLQEFWAGLGTGAGEPAADPFDPKILYDQYSGRLIVVTLGGQASPGSWLMIAVSRTSDPTDGFDQWAIDADVDLAPPPPAPSAGGGGGGGGCSLGRPGAPATPGTAAATFFLLVAPALLVALRKRRGRNRSQEHSSAGQGGSEPAG